MSPFAGLLRRSRRRASLSQAELARRSGLGIRTIRDLERGRTRRPRRDSTRLLADALHLDHEQRRAFERAAGVDTLPGPDADRLTAPAGPPAAAPAASSAPISLSSRVHQGDALPPLTARERSVLELMAEGCSNEAIAELLGIGARTVETHVRNVFWKLRLAPAPWHDRRVLAVLAYLRSDELNV